MLIAISPHLDDVALGCAGLTAGNPGAIVATVTAGKPPPQALTEWDRHCGFGEGDDVVGARRHEDEAALSHLGARPLWLEFLDRQYMAGQPPSPQAVAISIQAVLRDRAPDMVASPLGLGHPDHLVTAAACSQIARTMPDLAWVLYEDAIYRAVEGATEQAMSRMAADGFALRPLGVAEATQKRVAVERYASQLKGLGKLVLDAYQPERYWAVARRA